MRDLTPEEAKAKAREATDDLSAYINPTDIDETAETWSDINPERLGREIHKSVSIMVSEGQSPYKGLIHDLSMTLWQSGMPRVSMERLAIDDVKTAVIDWGIWPNKVDRFQCRELLEENPEVITSDVRIEASEAVKSGIADGLNPLNV